MLEHRHSLKGSRTAVALLVALIMVATLPGSASSKKKAPAPAPAKMDLSRFVWPKAPAITRIKFLDFFSAEKRDSTNQKKKSGWMGRMAGVSAENDKRTRPPIGKRLPSRGSSSWISSLPRRGIPPIRRRRAGGWAGWQGFQRKMTSALGLRSESACHHADQVPGFLLCREEGFHQSEEEERVDGPDGRGFSGK